jgi:hypothetical protein
MMPGTTDNSPLPLRAEPDRPPLGPTGGTASRTRWRTLWAMPSALDHVRDLADFVAASPSSFHAVAEGARRLSAAGFVAQDETEEWNSSPGGHYLVRDGALVAWRIPEGAGPLSAFRVVGSHTDSPTFKLKPRPDTGGYGWQQLGVEVYGGALLNSWLDRELGLAGRVFLRNGDSTLLTTGPLLRIPQLAVHLDRGVNEEGLKLWPSRSGRRPATSGATTSWPSTRRRPRCSVPVRSSSPRVDSTT